MPRIDPFQLLKCLSILLSPEGGILSRDEVPRLVNLMTKFSKKLVSKCVYVLILKHTETSLVDMFMAEGGWALIQTWLQDAAQAGNWVLVKEILGLLLITPVDVERLKMNYLPKLIKNLSRREDLDGVAQLSNQIVQNWLVIVKGTSHASSNVTQIQVHPELTHPETTNGSDADKVLAGNSGSIETYTHDNQNDISVEEADDDTCAIKPSTFYKVSVRDGKQIFKKLEPSLEGGGTEDQVKQSSSDESDGTIPNKQSKKEADGKVKDNTEKAEKADEKDKQSKSKSSSSSSSRKDRGRSKSSHSSSPSGSKHKSSISSSSGRSRDKSKSKGDKDKSSSKSRSDKHRDKEKEKRKSGSSHKSSSHSKDKNDSKEKDGAKEKVSKEKQAEKDKDTLAKLKPQTLDKLGRIPKKTASDDKQKEDKGEVKKKPSFSILDRKSMGEERTKTVKVYNSKMRSTGLEEEVKPPPPRNSKKPTPSIQLPTIPQKRHSPPRETNSAPLEKKIKIDKVDIPERPGSIKLIPPKPKPAVLQESDMFMDALTASATKKEPKKRKRRLSVTKDVPSSPTSTNNEQQSTTAPTSPPPNALGLKNIAPINFYQDTLSEETPTEEDKENSEVNQDPSDTPASPTTPTDPDDCESNPAKVPKLQDGLKGVLLYTKKKGPKRSISWKTEEQLVEIRYFELDETERVNVTKTFMDMAKMEMTSEREALQLSRKLINEDVMEPQTSWKMLYLCDQPEALANPGSKSLEKDIQFAREKSVLQALYFDKRRIPDSPEEPIPENHHMSDPIIIPLEDPDSQEIDLRSTPWPDPKGSPPVIESPQLPPVFHQNVPFNPNFNSINNGPQPGFVGMPPRFVAPSGPHGPPGPGNFVPPNLIHNNMMGPPNIHPQDVMMNPVGMNPNAFVQQGPMSDGFMGPGINENSNFSVPQFNGPPAPNMNMFGGPNNFNLRGPRGGYRRGGGGGWIRLSGSGHGPGHGNWKRGGHRGGRLCKNVQNHGYCRNRDNCQFVHPT